MTKQKQPAVSVIVPVYNVEKYLKECIDSILSQTFTDFECILVDDCSPDNCPAICDEYAWQDTRIKVIHKAQNEGLPLARRTGFENASGDYIQHIDSDDWVDTDMLEKMHAKAIAGNFDMVVCDYMYEGPNNRIYESQCTEKMDKIEIIKDIAIMKRLAASVCNKMTRREIFFKIQFPNQNYSEDRYITLQTIHHSQTIGYVNGAFYHYRCNANSITLDKKTIDKRIIEFYDIYVLVIKFLKEKYGENLTIFEPELSDRINSVKMNMFSNRRLRKLRNVRELYPESNKTYNGNGLSRMCFYLALNNRFMLLDITGLCTIIIKKIYRVVLPKNIRNSIWEKRK